MVATAAPPAGAPSTSPPSRPRPPVPHTLATGQLISHEHATSGTVQLIRLADGSHVVRLENLDTSNGPDLRVCSTDAPVKVGEGRLARLRRREVRQPRQAQGQQGKSELRPARGVDPSSYSSVSIWCDRFDVSFGAAELARV